MAHRLTLSKARNNRLIREAAAVPCDSDEMKDRINDAHRALVESGEWWGTYQRYMFCAKDGCVRVIPHIARIMAATVECVNMTLKDEFFRFQDIVFPPNDNNTSRKWADSQGEFALFNGLGSTAKFIRVYPERPEDVGVEVIIKGYDSANQRVQTTDMGSVIDGMKLTIASPYATTTSKFSSITSIQSSDTRVSDLNFWWLDDDGNQNAIAVLYPQWDNTWYRGYRFPFGITDTTIMAVVKLEHYDVINDDDFLIIQSPEAIAHEIRAQQFEMSEDFGRAQLFRHRAYQVLENQIQHYRGHSKTIEIRRQGATFSKVV